MRRGSLLAMILAAVLFATSGCGLVPGLPGSGGGENRVDQLWPDVPQVPGSTRVDVGLPLPARLLLEGFVNAANASAEPGEGQLRDFELVVYELAGSGTDLGTVYSADAMGALGWTGAEGACGAAAGGEVEVVAGGLCAYSKTTDTEAQDLLLIVLLPGEGTGGNDQVAYVRFLATQQT